MALFLNLYLGHLIADYALQPGALVRAKRSSLAALLLHVGVIGIATSLVMWDRSAYYWPTIVMAMGAHFVIEELTIAARIQTPTRGLFVFVFDQTLHILSIWLLVWLTGQWEITSLGQFLWFDLSLAEMAAVDAFVTVTLLGSILAFEAAGAFVGDRSHKTTILKWDVPRILGITERGVSFAASLAVAWTAPELVPAGLGLAALAGVALITPFAPRAAFALTRRDRRERARHLVEGATGLVLCALSLGGVLAVAALARI